MYECLTPCSSAGGPLDNLNINPDTIAISGFSSGGYFSTQFHVAFSEKVTSCRYIYYLLVPAGPRLRSPGWACSRRAPTSPRSPTRPTSTSRWRTSPARAASTPWRSWAGTGCTSGTAASTPSSLSVSVGLLSSAANRLIGEVVQSWRRPLLGPSPG